VTPETAESFVLRYFVEVWQRADPDALDAFLAPDYVDHDPPPGVGGTREDQRTAILLLRDATRDRKVQVRKACATPCPEGALVTVRHDTTWCQLAPLFGLPGGDAAVQVRGCDLYRVRGGRIVESWHAESITRS